MTPTQEAWRVTVAGRELGLVLAAGRHAATARAARRFGVPAAAVRVRAVRPAGGGGRHAAG